MPIINPRVARCSHVASASTQSMDNYEQYKRVLVNAERSCHSVRHLFGLFFRKVSMQAKIDAYHSLVSLCVALQEAITAISDIDHPKGSAIHACRHDGNK